MHCRNQNWKINKKERKSSFYFFKAEKKNSVIKAIIIFLNYIMMKKVFNKLKIIRIKAKKKNVPNI